MREHPQMESPVIEPGPQIETDPDEPPLPLPEPKKRELP
jgi:hypothetical protein